MKPFVLLLLVLLGVLASRVARADDLDACIAAADRAQPLRDDGRFLDARRELLLCARATCPTAIRSACTRWLADVEHRTPTVVVRARDALGNDVTDVVVSVDGAPLQSKLDGLAHPVDPGEHSFRFERGAAKVERRVVLTEGDRARSIEVAFDLPRAPAIPAMPAPAPSAPRLPAPPSRTAAWVLGGVGAALLVGASAAWTIGLVHRSELASSCADTHACSDNAVSRARVQLVVGDVLGAAGIVVLGTALYLGLRTRVAVEPRVGGAVTSLRVAF